MPTRDDAIAALTAAGPFELTEDASEGLPPLRVYKNAPASLREVLQGTLAHGDKPFLIYEDEVTSYAAALRPGRRAGAAAAGRRSGEGRPGRYRHAQLSGMEPRLVGLPGDRRIAVSLNAWWTAAGDGVRA